MKKMTKRCITVGLMCIITIFCFTGSSSSINFKVIKKWPSGIIPYYITSDFTPDEVCVIIKSMHRWEDSNVILFIPRTSQEVFVIFEKNYTGMNSSAVGFCEVNRIRLYNFDAYIIDHELGHCLGLRHEHQRPDRDRYVTILWDNMMDNKDHNFVKLDSYEFLYDYTKYPYDFNSIMHYDVYDFSKNGKKVIKIHDSNNKVNCFTISKYDLEKIVEIYGN